MMTLNKLLKICASLLACISDCIRLTPEDDPENIFVTQEDDALFTNPSQEKPKSSAIEIAHEMTSGRITTSYQNTTRGQMLIMADVDDTLTCPALGRGGLKAKLAGSDMCSDMAPGQIYYGVGLFLYLLAYKSGPGTKFVIVSANPRASMHHYSHIKQYIDSVSKACQLKTDSSVSITLNDVRKGQIASSALGHVAMGIRKLHHLIKQTNVYSASSVVWVGDTGQGDVCAGFCFIYPTECSKETPLFYTFVNNWCQHYKDACSFLATGIAGTDPLQHVSRYALFHVVNDLTSNDGAKHECLQAALAKLPDKRIGFFGLMDQSSRKEEYLHAIEEAARLDLISEDIVVPTIGTHDRRIRHGDRNVSLHAEDAEETVRDCFDAADWNEGIYRKKG